jgi:hypothetical protein
MYETTAFKTNEDTGVGPDTKGDKCWSDVNKSWSCFRIVPTVAP